MKHFAIYIALGLCVFGSSNAWGQAALRGNVSGVFTNPVDGDVEGVGTNVVVFPNAPTNGVLRFTPTASYSAADTPFLLGRVDFQSVGTSVTGLTFQVSLGTEDAGGTIGAVDFCTEIAVIQGGEPGFREINLRFDPNATHTSAVDGIPYTFQFAGLTDSEEWTGLANDTLFSVANQDNVVGYLWATVVQAPEGTPLDPNCNDCGCTPPPGVPEPATGLLAAIGVAGLALGRRFRQRAFGGEK